MICSSFAIYLLSLGCLLSIAPVLGKPADEEADGEEGDDEAEEEDYLGHEIKECATLTGEKEGAPVWTYRCKDIFTHLMMLMMTRRLALICSSNARPLMEL